MRNKNSDKKHERKTKGQNPGYSNDQIGENAGEGRMAQCTNKKPKRS